MIVERVAISRDVGFTVYSFGRGDRGVLIVAGLHGDEVCSIAVAMKLIEKLRNIDVKGLVKVIPIANELGLRYRSRVNPIDGMDLNRVFPGDENGSCSERIAARIWELAKNSLYVIDLHCGGNSIPYILASKLDRENVRSFVERIPIEAVVPSMGVRGQLFIEALEIGIPAVLIEIPGGRTYDIEMIESMVERLVVMLANLGIIKRKGWSVSQRVFSRYIAVRAHIEGLFEPRKRPGDEISEGDELGVLAGEKVLSPVSGLVLSITKPCYVAIGESIARIAIR